MLDKYFGFMKIEDEDSVIESFLEHNRIDEEEIELLSSMVSSMCENDMEAVETQYGQIRTISMDSGKAYESVAEQIINANFDSQKQYDLLRLYQRIGSISGLIISSAKRLVILARIGGKLPKELHQDVKTLMTQVKQINELFKTTLTKYLKDKKLVIDLLSQIEDLENTIDHQRSICLEILYKLGNEKKLPLGDFRAIENIVEHLEDASDAIEEAATSLEWLLLY